MEISSADFDRALLGASFVHVRQRLYAVALVALVEGEASSSDVTESLYSAMIVAARGLGLVREADAFKRETAKKDEAARFASCYKAARDIVASARVAAKDYGAAITATLRGCNDSSDEGKAAHLMRHMLAKPWGTPEGAARIQAKNKKAAQRAKARDMAAAGETPEGNKAARDAASLQTHAAHVSASDARDTIAALFAAMSLMEQAATITGLLASLPVQENATPMQVVETLMAAAS